MPSWASWAHKNAFRIGGSGSLSHSPLSFFFFFLLLLLCLFPLYRSSGLCVGGEKEDICVFNLLCLFWKALLWRCSPCSELGGCSIVRVCGNVAGWCCQKGTLILVVQMNPRSHDYSNQNAWSFLWLCEEATENGRYSWFQCRTVPGLLLDQRACNFAELSALNITHHLFQPIPAGISAQQKYRSIN